jgi:hypothetical protein
VFSRSACYYPYCLFLNCLLQSQLPVLQFCLLLPRLSILELPAAVPTACSTCHYRDCLFFSSACFYPDCLFYYPYYPFFSIACSYNDCLFSSSACYYRYCLFLYCLLQSRLPVLKFCLLLSRLSILQYCLLLFWLSFLQFCLPLK